MKNEIDGVPHRKNNSRPAKKAHLKNFRATNERYVHYAAAKDHLGCLDVESDVLNKRKVVTTFAAKGRDS